mgnify:CR=1 FL=1
MLAVEMFRVGEHPAYPDGFLVNELAMRPHNSGHWSIDGAGTSQFEQHLRAVLDLPLGDPRPVAQWTAMANVLGSLAGTHLACKPGTGFVRGVFIFVVSALILKPSYDAFLR